MTDSELKAVLQAEKLDAMGSMQSSKLVDERTAAMDYYMGDVSADMPTQDGRSKAVSSDVSDTIEGLMPPLMEIFCSSDEVVKFSPVGPEDVEAAEQETDYVNHVFMQKNPGYIILYSFIKDALLSKNGIVKVCWEEYEKEERETYHDLPEEAFTIISQDPRVEVVEHTPNEDGTHDVTVVASRMYGCAKVYPVPPEEFGISRSARSIAESEYCYHEVKRPRSKLIDEGYDEAQLNRLRAIGEIENDEAQSRNTVEEFQNTGSDLNKAAAKIRVTEHFIVMSYEDGEKARLYKVVTGGEEAEVLRKGGKPDVSPYDAQPFASMTPVPQTHRFWGRSLADMVMDIMREKTALKRAFLDNIYLLNNQRYVVSEAEAGDRTIDDLLVNRPGGMIRVKTNAPAAVVPLQNQPLGQVILPAMEYLDATREWKTGVTRQGQGIDAKALQNQSATAVNQVFTAAQARVKLIARNLAETGIRDLFALLHATIRKNDRQQNTVRLRNKWVTVDPRNWKTRDDMTIEVGLGGGTKAEEVGILMQLLQVQREAMMAPQLGLVEPVNIYNALKKLCEATDLKTVEPYFTDPRQKGPQPPPPDPKMVEAEGKLAIQKQETEAKLQLEQGKAQVEQQTTQAKLSAEIQMLREKMMAEIQLKREQMTAEFALKREEMMLEAQLKREIAAVTARNSIQESDANVANVEMGGNLG